MNLIAYSTIQEVRALSGTQGQRMYKVLMRGVANGTNKTFSVPNLHIVDHDFDEDGFDAVPSYVADVTVYDDDVSVAITSVDVNTGTIVLTAAPAAASVMKVTYSASPIKDSDIVALINRMDARINLRSRTAITATAYTQVWDGNGKKTKFYFRYTPVVAINSYIIDDATSGYTEKTDYWLYPEPARATWIEFESAPSLGNQNVSITYNYGETNLIVNQLSKTLAAIEVIEQHTGTVSMSQGTYSGIDMEPVFVQEQSHIFLIRRLKEDVTQLWIDLGGTIKMSVI